MAKKDEAEKGLVKLHQISAAVFVVLGIAVVWFMKAVRYPLTLGHSANNALLGQKETAFVPASHHLWDTPLWVVLLVLLFIAVVYSFLITQSSLKASYLKGLTRRVSPHRWIYIAVTAALMIEITAMLSGLSDIMELKLMAGAVTITYLLGWLAEIQNRTARKPNWSAYGLSVATGVTPWLVIVSAAAGTLLWGLVRSPWYVYAVYAVLLIGFCLLAWNQMQQYKKVGKWKDYYFVERNYLLIQNTTLALFALILIIGLHK